MTIKKLSTVPRSRLILRSPLTTSAGAPIQGQLVVFVAVDGTVTGATAATDAQGQASVGSWTLEPTPGVNQLLVVAGTDSVTFDATGILGPPVQATSVNLDSQVVAAGQPVEIPPAVTIVDIGGNPLEGIEVTFAVTAGGGSVAGGTQLTDAEGVATVGSWTLGTEEGENIVEAQVDGVDPASFVATGIVGATAVEVQAGEGQVATVNTAVSDPIQVLVTDASQFPVEGAAVTFEVGAGGGSVTGGTAVTDAQGIAEVGTWTLGTTAGFNALRATVINDVSTIVEDITPAIVSATGEAGAAASVAPAGGGRGVDPCWGWRHHPTHGSRVG